MYKLEQTILGHLGKTHLGVQGGHKGIQGGQKRAQEGHMGHRDCLGTQRGHFGRKEVVLELIGVTWGLNEVTLGLQEVT